MPSGACACDQLDEIGTIRRCRTCGKVYTLHEDGTLEPLTIDELEEDEGTDKEHL